MKVAEHTCVCLLLTNSVWFGCSKILKDSIIRRRVEQAEVFVSCFPYVGQLVLVLCGVTI
jgi:hypothetical protein